MEVVLAKEKKENNINAVKNRCPHMDESEKKDGACLAGAILPVKFLDRGNDVADLSAPDQSRAQSLARYLEAYKKAHQTIQQILPEN